MKTHPPHYSGCEKIFVITVISYSVLLIYDRIFSVDIVVINTFLHSFFDIFKVLVPVLYLIAPVMVNLQPDDHELVIRFGIGIPCLLIMYLYSNAKFIAVFLYTFI